VSEATVIPLPLWRHPRRTGALLVILGALVILLGVGLVQGSHDLEDSLSDQVPRPPPPAPPPPSTSAPTSTSS
jgi:hypothetical protein